MLDANFDIEKHILDVIKIKTNQSAKCTFEDLYEYLEHKRKNNSMREVKLQEKEIYDYINKLLKRNKIEVA